MYKTYNCIQCGNQSRFRYAKKNLYCSIKCQQLFERNERINKWLNEGIDWADSRRVPDWAISEIINRNGYYCSVCGISEHNGKSLRLECDHIDGNASNNNINNLRLICPNCHSQTDTYKNKNRGNGRKFRRTMLV